MAKIRAFEVGKGFSAAEVAEGTPQVRSPTGPKAFAFVQSAEPPNSSARRVTCRGRRDTGWQPQGRGVAAAGMPAPSLHRSLSAPRLQHTSALRTHFGAKSCSPRPAPAAFPVLLRHSLPEHAKNKAATCVSRLRSPFQLL